MALPVLPPPKLPVPATRIPEGRYEPGFVARDSGHFYENLWRNVPHCDLSAVQKHVELWKHGPLQSHVCRLIFFLHGEVDVDLVEKLYIGFGPSGGRYTGVLKETNLDNMATRMQTSTLGNLNPGLHAYLSNAIWHCIIDIRARISAYNAPPNAAAPTVLHPTIEGVAFNAAQSEALLSPYFNGDVLFMMLQHLGGTVNIWSIATAHTVKEPRSDMDRKCYAYARTIFLEITKVFLNRIPKDEQPTTVTEKVSTIKNHRTAARMYHMIREAADRFRKDTGTSQA